MKSLINLIEKILFFEIIKDDEKILDTYREKSLLEDNRNAEEDNKRAEFKGFDNFDEGELKWQITN